MNTTENFKHRVEKTSAEADEKPELSHEDLCRLGRVFMALTYLTHVALGRIISEP